jgi:menaquinol-cytochrome c reductase iron-sulfur subunit
VSNSGDSLPLPDTPRAEDMARRRFLSSVTLGLATLAGAVLSIPIVSYLLSPLIRPSPRHWVELGRVPDFKIGETVLKSIRHPSPLPWAGSTAQTAAWVRRTSETDFVVFAVNCTHLGCPVNWLPGAQLFLCPCHGGVYNADGSVAGGPPPRSLFRYQARVRGGRLEALTGPLPIA